MNAWMEKATQIAGDVYSDFLRQVVEDRVLKERVGALSDESRRRIDKGTHIDPRVLRLMAVSGKGGWDKNPEKWRRYELNTNVTLLDHLLSVARGALLLYALDKLGQNPEMDASILEKRLRVIAIIAFLHDLDKLLKLERNTRLPLDEIENAVDRYRLAQFLAPEKLSAEQIRYLIELVEDTQRHRSPPAELPPRNYDSLMGYIALADKLDGIWLSSDPEKGGLTGVLIHLGKVQTLYTDLVRHWRSIDLFDPHHPFLLDELQRWLSWFSFRLTGVLPLIEIHHDGRLFMLLPTAEFETIVEQALNKLCADLPFNLDVAVSDKDGSIKLFDDQPNYSSLRVFIDSLPRQKIARIFLVKAGLQRAVTKDLDRLLKDFDLAPRWPNKSEGLVSLYAINDDLSTDADADLRKVALLVMLINLNVAGDKKGTVPDYAQREQMLLDTICQERPAWLNSVQDGVSRRTLTALWVLALAKTDQTVEDALWGETGLLRCWLEGKEERRGFNAFIEMPGKKIIPAVKQHLRQMLCKQRITVLDETAQGRCLFTDEPVPINNKIEKTTGLYEVKMSAFSGRDNRPESMNSAQPHTNVGPVSVAEYKLRARVHANAGGLSDGVPTLISSPSTSGLFGGLGFHGDQAMASLSLYDLSREEIKKGSVYKGVAIYKGRYRMARFERIADKTSEQIDQLRMLLKASRRLGRPIHVFRGLPTPQRAFFHYDAMPRLLANLIGGNSLRLEQIPNALEQLQLAQVLLEMPGLGYDVLMQYANPHTRFGTLCLVWCHLRDAGSARFLLIELERNLDKLLEEYPMSEQDGALVRLGKAAACIQRRPLGKTSTSEEMRVFKLCLDFAESARAYGQTDDTSLINGIASELEINLVRKNEMAARTRRNNQSLQDGCLEVATLFVHEVWHGLLKGRSPTQRTRRTLGSIYRMSFLYAGRSQSEEINDSTTTTATD